ncbi:MAG: RluA family pseudouridine synthase [Fibrobacter sp.]|jgi:23S rRNA pseudouridine955/2504/2580 synthase|nr:RluA family pseudouridine synthase [Fibrobacter sp.]
MITKIIDRHHANMRLDRYLRQSFSTESLSALFAVIRKKKVRVNGVVAKAPLILNEGDLVAIYENLKEDNSTSAPKTGWGNNNTYCDPLFFKNHFQIALETEDFVIVEKPSGIDSQPGSGTRPKETLVDMLWQWGLNEKHDFKPTLVHRLDRETSGLLIAAIQGDVLRGLTKLIREHKINKYYYALVQGHLEKTKGTIKTNLERSDSPQGAKMKTSESKGKESITHYIVYRRFESMDLVKIKLETGRMHQIRAHFASINHPLAGDSRYGDYAWNRELRKEYGLNRLFLHSFKLEFEWNNQKYNVESKLPKELDQIVRTLSKKSIKIED